MPDFWQRAKLTAMSDKQLALNVLGQLPDTLTLEQISEELAIWAAIRRAEADIAAGRVHTHEEVREMVAQWSSR